MIIVEIAMKTSGHKETPENFLANLSVLVSWWQENHLENEAD